MTAGSEARKPLGSDSHQPPTLELPQVRLPERPGRKPSHIESLRQPILTGILSCILCLYFSLLLVQLLPGRSITFEPLRFLVNSPSARFLVLVTLGSQVFLSLVALAGSVLQLIAAALGPRHDR
jgi:hypothetical protein